MAAKIKRLSKLKKSLFVFQAIPPTAKQAAILAENRRNYNQVFIAPAKNNQKIKDLGGTLAKYLTKAQIKDLRENIRDKVDRF